MEIQCDNGYLMISGKKKEGGDENIKDLAGLTYLFNINPKKS